MLLFLLIGAALAGPPPADLPLGRDIRVSVAEDHVFFQLRASAVPADLGRDEWSDFDRDGSGSIDAAERVPLLEALRRHETEYTAFSVGEQPLLAATFEVVGLGTAEATALDERVTFRVQGRTELAPSADGWPFVFYDRPRAWQGAVPIRLSVARGLHVDGVLGARAELRGPQRLDAVVSNRAPAVWGRVVPAP